MLWQSSDAVHRLKIEIGRYIKVYNEHTIRYEQLPREKRICDICKGKVEDEQHFILECALNENLRQDLLSKLEIKHIQLWNETEKIKYFFETASESDLQKFAKFVSNSFEKHRKYSNKA